MSAGTGILHSEKNDSWRLSGERHTDPVRFIQMWVTPDDSGIDPGINNGRSAMSCSAAGW